MKRHNPILYIVFIMAILLVVEEWIPGWDDSIMSNVLTSIEVIVLAILAYIFGSEE